MSKWVYLGSSPPKILLLLFSLRTPLAQNLFTSTICERMAYQVDGRIDNFTDRLVVHWVFQKGCRSDEFWSTLCVDWLHVEEEPAIKYDF